MIEAKQNPSVLAAEAVLARIRTAFMTLFTMKGKMENYAWVSKNYCRSSFATR